MPVPKRKVSRKRRDQRSANKHIMPQSFSLCPQEGCNEAIMSHRACSSCGFYKGVSILNVKKNTVNKREAVTKS